MKLMEKINEGIKRTVRSWLNVVPANPYNFQINEMLDFEAHAIRNRIWYREMETNWNNSTSRTVSMQIGTSSGRADLLQEWTCARSIQGCLD